MKGFFSPLPDILVIVSVQLALLKKNISAAWEQQLTINVRVTSELIIGVGKQKSTMHAPAF
jgi:hypothetical protein